MTPDNRGVARVVVKPDHAPYGTGCIQYIDRGLGT